MLVNSSQFGRRSSGSLGARAVVSTVLFFALAAAPAGAAVTLPEAAPSLHERIDPGVPRPANGVRIGLSASGEAVTLGASRGTPRLLDGRSGAALDVGDAPPPWRIVSRGGREAGARTVYRIQVGSFREESRARALARELEQELRAETSVAWEPSRKVWRVRVGGASTRAALDGLLVRVRELGYDDAWVGSDTVGVSEGGELALVDRAWTVRPLGTDRIVALPPARGRLTVGESSYRGVVELWHTPTGEVRAINELGLEEYLRGVVPKELGPAAFPELEAIKAQSVAARTYMLANLGQYAADGYDICDTPRCQVYGGADAEHPLSDRAIRETAGEILVHRGRPINAMYTSTCGGHTEDLQIVFPEMTGEYLRGVPCVADEETLATRRVTVRGSAPPPGGIAPDAGSGDGLLVAANLVARGVVGPEALDPAILLQPADRPTVERWGRALALAAGRPTPREMPAGAPTRLSIWRSWWGELASGAGAGPVRRGDASVVLAVSDADALAADDRRLAAELVARGLVVPDASGRLGPGEVPPLAEVLGWLVRAAERFGLVELREGTVLGAADGRLRIEERRSARGWRLVPGELLVLTSLGGAWHRVPEIELVVGDRVRFDASATGLLRLLAVEERKGQTDDRYSSRYRWRLVRERRELDRSVERVAPVGRLRDLRILSRGVSGRVAEIEVVGTEGRATVRGFRLRRALGLLDTLFDVEIQRGTDGLVRRIVFEGRGWGHGVGMCQVGAYGMALRDRSYREILGHYYSGVKIERPLARGR
jgi:stage II sporulation protein D